MPFVWLMLFSYFSVPPALQRRVLVYGVQGRSLRTVMIFTGSWLILPVRVAALSLRCFPLFTGVKMALARMLPASATKPLVRWIRQPSADDR